MRCLSTLVTFFVFCFYGISQSVGIGTNVPDHKLTIYETLIQGNTNTHVLKLKGQNPVLTFSDQNNNSYGYLKMWSYQPFAPFTNGMVIGANPGYPIFLSTNNYGATMTIADNGNVGVGTTLPDFKMTIHESVIQGNTNTNVLKLKGQNPVLSFSDQNNNSYGYIKMWSHQPFAPYTNGMVIGANPGYPIFLSTNNYGATMTVADNGNVGIGTTTPSAKLHINQDNEALRLSGDNTYLSFYNGSIYKGFMWSTGSDMIFGTASNNTLGNLHLSIRGTPSLIVQNDGRVRVGPFPTIQPLNSQLGSILPKFSVHGPLALKSTSGDQAGEWAIMYDYYSGFNVNELNCLMFYFNGGRKAYVSEYDGSWNEYSDLRLKENFENYKSVLDGIKELDVLTYHYKADKTATRSFGLLAQNVKQYFPEIVSTGGPDGLMGISYAKTGVLAIKAIQEQQGIIETLQKENTVLKKRIERLEKMMLSK